MIAGHLLARALRLLDRREQRPAARGGISNRCLIQRSARQDRAWLTKGRGVHRDVEPSTVGSHGELDRSALAVVTPNIDDSAYPLLEKRIALGDVTPEGNQVGFFKSRPENDDQPSSVQLINQIAGTRPAARGDAVPG